MIKTLSINGFKTLLDFSIDLGVVNVFIGANGSGKSNILEALGVLSAAASGRIDDESLMRRGVRPGLPRLYKSSFRGDRTPPDIILAADSTADADYRVSLLNPLDDPKPSWEFKAETLRYSGARIISRGVRQKHQYDSALGLAALKAVELEKENPASHLLRELKEYAIYSANTPALRGVVPDPQSREPLGLSGGRLAGAVASKTYSSANIQAPLFDDLPCEQVCPPASDTTEKLEEVVERWLLPVRIDSRTVLCMPSKSIESWVAAALYAESDAGFPDMIECSWDVLHYMHAKPARERLISKKDGRLRKRKNKYKLAQRSITERWDTVEKFCSQAVTFRNSLEEAVAQIH